MTEQTLAGPRVVTGRSARFSASIFNYLNIVALLIPVPLGIFWFGASMLVYAMNRHHPNPRVGYYTQLGAYRLYAVAGAIIPVATFFGAALVPWLVTWLLAVLIIVPWSIYDLVRIHGESWQDVPLPEEDR